MNTAEKRLMLVFPRLRGGLLLLTACLCSAAFGQLPLVPYSSRCWEMDEGLPQPPVQSIAQTTDGYLWLAAQDVLVRFDGTAFEPVPYPPAATNNPWIGDLCASRAGGLWIGSEDGRMFRYRNGQFASFDYPGMATNMVLTLVEDQRARLWIATRSGLFRLEHDNISPVVIKDISPRTAVRSLCQDKQGNIWIAFNGGLIAVDASDKVVARYRAGTNGLPSEFVRAVFCDRDGSVWVGSNAGVSRLKDGQFTHYTKADGLPDNVVKMITQDRRGNIWVGSFGGLARWSNGRFVVEHQPDGNAFLSITSFFEDREGNFWVGTKEGLHRLNPRQFDHWTIQHGLVHNNVICVLQDRSGALWIGGNGGLQKYQDGTWQTFSVSTVKEMKNDIVLSVVEAGDGSIWFGEDYDGGLYRMDHGSVRRFSKDAGLPTTAIRVLHEDRQGRFWAGTSSGLFVRNKQKFSRIDQVRTNRIEVVRCLAEDAAGRLWVGSENGLFLCGATSDFPRFGHEQGLSSAFIYALYSDPQTNLWIGTAEGLCYLSNEYASAKRVGTDKPVHFKSFCNLEGMSPGAVVEILEDDDGHLWLGTKLGVRRVKKQQLIDYAAGRKTNISIVTFGKSDGMASPVCVGTAKPSACKTRDGRLWFTTTKGVAFTNPALVAERNELAPPVVVQKVIANRRPVPLPPAGGPAVLTIAPGRGELEIHYNGLSYTAPERNRFKYRLEGIDSDWVDAGSRRIANYNSVAPGRYTFRVLASNNDGVWNNDGAMLTVILQPHFWQTRWFLGFAVVSMSGVVAGAGRYVTRRKMMRKLQELERQHAVEKERTRIAKDMHDEVGAKLTKISFLTEIAKRDLARPEQAASQIDKMAFTVREVIRALDEIVWSVNPKNDTLDHFANYLCRHASEYFENTPVRCQLDIPPVLAPIPLPTDVRHNLFLAYKETLNNVLKHAGATQVQISLKVNVSEAEITIADNGRGFDVRSKMASAEGARARVGNGLFNLQQRLASIGGRCEIDSAVGKGTTVRFVLPLR